MGKELFDNIYSDTNEDKVTGFPWENLCNSLWVWAYVDSALNADKWNSCRSSRYAVMVGNISVITNTFTQTLVEKSTYISEFVRCKAVVNKVLGV